MLIKRKLRKINTTFYLAIPPDLIKHYKFNSEDVLVIDTNDSKFLKIWKERKEDVDTETVE
tara:strand:- start:14 stop:196 length:183 start_codon:yes stop_codon:yes gene_type:complete